MTTSLYLVLVLGVGAVYAALARGGIAEGMPTWWFVVGLPFVYLAVALVLVLQWFVLSRIWGDVKATGEPLSRRDGIRMLVQEVLTVVTSWPAILLHRLLIRDPQRVQQGMPILLIHGVWNNDGVWLAFRRRIARQRIGPVYTINCGPTLGDIEHFADQLASKIEQICLATGARCMVLVGHSMGGLIARSYMRQYGGCRVAKLITIGTPHHGSMLARAAIGRCVEQMRPGNAWLADLNRAELSQQHEAPIVTIWSCHDTMVAPQTSSQLAGAQSIVLAGIGHNALLRHPAVLAHVLTEIRSAGACPDRLSMPLNVAAT